MNTPPLADTGKALGFLCSVLLWSYFGEYPGQLLCVLLDLLNALRRDFAYHLGDDLRILRFAIGGSLLLECEFRNDRVVGEW